MEQTVTSLDRSARLVAGPLLGLGAAATISGLTRSPLPNRLLGLETSSQ